jgi:putative peptidoglycan lipid II flippase
VSFIPVFVESRQGEASGNQQETDLSKNFVSAMFTCLFCFLTLLTVLGVLFADDLLRLILDENYSLVPGKFDLTVRMAQIMFGFIFFMSLFGFFMGVLNALGVFALPALAPTLFNMAMIISTLVPQKWFPQPGDGLAWGVLFGGALQMGILLPALKRKGYLPHFKWVFWGPPCGALVKKVFLNMVPGFLGMGLLQFTTLINLNFASQLGEGVISYIYWADRLLELPLSLISVSLGTALLPTLSGLWSQGSRIQFSKTVSDYLRINLYAALPSAVGLFFLSQLLVEIIFLRGKFTPSDALQTSQVLQVYAFILITTSSVRVLVPAYYAVKNTWFPAVVSGFCLVAHLFFAPIFMEKWGLWGLNLSTFFSGALNLILLLSFYPKWISPFQWKSFFGAIKFFVPSAGLGVVCLAGTPLSIYLMDFVHPFYARLMSFCIVLTVSGIVFMGLSQILNLPEYDRTCRPILKKLGLGKRRV